MEIERKQFALISQAGTPTGFGRNISFKMFRRKESSEFSDGLAKQKSSNSYGPDFIMSQDEFAIEASD